MADDERDERVAAWLAVEPLDDVARRRLVATAIGDLHADDGTRHHAPHAWRWIAAAAVVVIGLVVGLALLTAEGGHDERATSRRPTALTPRSGDAARDAVRDVGDYGDLDQSANLAALRQALAQAPDRSTADAQASGAAPTPELEAPRASASPRCGAVIDGGHVVARGTGTVAGRPATVVLIEGTQGARSFEMVLEDPCEIRDLP